MSFTLDATSTAAGMTMTVGGAFTWTPTEAQGGITYPVTVTVSDGALSDAETFNIVVAEVNAAPVLGAIGNRNVDELATLAFTATATDPDLPAQTLTFTLDAASTAAGMAMTTGGAFTWTPTEAQGGTTYPVTVTVSDGTLTDAETFNIVVAEVNAAPVLGAIGNRNVDELATLAFTATATDTDVPPQALSFTLDATSTAAGMTMTAGGAFTWTPTEAQGGVTYPVTVTVSDGTLTDAETFNIVVAEVNAAPVLAAIGNRNVDELATLAFTATATDTDLPAQTLTFTLDATSTAAGMAMTAGGAFTWTPTEAQGGTTYPVTVTVSDGTLSDAETFNIVVAEVNAAPVLGAIGNRNVDELVALAFTATATDPDLPAQTLTFTLDATSTAAGMTMTAGGAFTWTPTEAQGGITYPVTVTVSDGTLTDAETFNIVVAEVNAAPVLGAIGNRNVDELATLAFTATATDTDVPPQTLSFTLDATSTAAGMTMTAGGAFTWTPTEAQGGTTYPVTVTVSDGTLSDAETFNIVVAEVNAAPVLAAIGNRNVDELVALAFTATATDPDLPAQTLTFTLDATSTAAGMAMTAGGAFTWTPTEAQGGTTYPVTVTVSDGTLSDAETFNIVVAEVNAAPVLAAIGNRNVDELATLAFTATATDTDVPATDIELHS